MDFGLLVWNTGTDPRTSAEQVWDEMREMWHDVDRMVHENVKRTTQ